jgi:hypothetical protein
MSSHDSGPSFGAHSPLSPPPTGVTSNSNEPQDEQRYVQLVVTMAVLIPVSTICVLLRVWIRAMIVKRFGWDDGIPHPRLLSDWMLIFDSLCCLCYGNLSLFRSIHDALLIQALHLSSSMLAAPSVSLDVRKTPSNAICAH